MPDPEPTPKRPRGRPPRPTPRLDATPEEVARRIFENAKPPDPSRRRKRRRVDKKHPTSS